MTGKPNHLSKQHISRETSERLGINNHQNLLPPREPAQSLAKMDNLEPFATPQLRQGPTSRLLKRRSQAAAQVRRVIKKCHYKSFKRGCNLLAFLFVLSQIIDFYMPRPKAIHICELKSHFGNTGNTNLPRYVC